MKTNIIFNEDCIGSQGICILPDKSIDMVLADMPYGTTACKWDSIIPFEPLWKQLKRVIKSNGAIVLTASQPFTSRLVMSNLKMFKYCWVWEKSKGTGHLNAKRMPMNNYEDIVVFYKKQCLYNPQLTKGKSYKEKSGWKGTEGYEGYGVDKRIGNDNKGFRYPKRMIKFGVVERGTLHPTQKPVALMEYLIKTYTNEGEVVLDFAIGSGTTAVACRKLNRQYIGFEISKKYYKIARQRLQAEKTLWD